MNRRDFLKRSFALLAFSALAGKLHGANRPAETPEPEKDLLVALKGGEAIERFDRGIAQFGGIGKFVKAGQTVLIKPNIAWNRGPETGANTNPELVGHMVRRCLEAGAAKVWVFDHTCNEMNQSYQTSGIRAAVEANGGQMLSSNRKEDYREVEIKGAKRLKRALVHSAVLDCDVFLNVPVLKHHGGAGMTAAMKNFMGIVFDRQYMHRNDLNACIADSCLIRKPDLNVIDAERVMLTGGPQGHAGSKSVRMRSTLMSRDLVGVDVAAAKLAGFSPDRLRYLADGEDRRLGHFRLEELDIKRIVL